MCGIVGGIAQRNVVPILLEGLKRLEYRGYDSAGLAVIHNNEIYRKRELGKVKGLEAMLLADPIAGHITECSLLLLSSLVRPSPLYVLLLP